MRKYSILNISGHEKLSPSMPRNSCYGQILDYFSSAIAACAERYSGRTFWTTAPYPSNHLAYDPNDYFPPFLTLHIKFEEAEAYRKATGCYLRKNQWEDLTVDVYL